MDRRVRAVVAGGRLVLLLGRDVQVEARDEVQVQGNEDVARIRGVHLLHKFADLQPFAQPPEGGGMTWSERVLGKHEDPERAGAA